jgi:hypothetical protein
MLRAAVLGAVLVVLGLGGCGDEGSSESGKSTPAPTPTATATLRDDYYAAMDDLVTRLDRAVAAAISGEKDAVARIKGVIRDVREQLRKRRAAGDGESPAGNFVLTTAASARDYARNGERQGLKLIRDVPIVEARDALKNEAAAG